VFIAIIIKIKSDDLASVVDAVCNGSEGARRRILDGGISATTKKEAVVDEVVRLITPDDLAGVVDAPRLGAEGRDGWGSSMVV
jgi:hypothetical protein